MTKAFKVGDRVSWNSEAGRVSGTIIWKDSFLEDKKKLLPYATQFACGYIRGVLENLLPQSIGGISVRRTGTIVFSFTKTSSVSSGKKSTKRRMKKRRLKS